MKRYSVYILPFFEDSSWSDRYNFLKIHNRSAILRRHADGE